MARQLTWWGAGAAAVCVLIAAAYLPPRGASPPRSRTPRAAPPTAARLQAQALAEQWREMDLALRLAQFRNRLEPEFERRRHADVEGPALLFAGGTQGNVAAEFERTVRQTLDAVWRSLDLGVSKVAVGVVLETGGALPPPPSPAASNHPQIVRARSYLLPDSTDRAACVAYVPADRWERWLQTIVPARRTEQLAEWLKLALGPCAFYAGFGTPGRPARRWLAARHYTLAVVPDWSPSVAAEVGGHSAFVHDPATGRWWWSGISGMPVSAVGCLGGRATSCEDAVLAGSGDRVEDSLPRIVTITPSWWRAERLLEEDRFLADVVREVGHDRFLRFWNSPLAVEPSLAAALRAPVGEWTARWQRRFAPRLPLGPIAPLSAGVTGVLLAGVAVLSALLAAIRRQAR
ncbi:MAG: hypothetical protein ACREL9_05735 [Gemmatimonadales bacterium]